jgi:hypothetical protein
MRQSIRWCNRSPEKKNLRPGEMKLACLLDEFRIQKKIQENPAPASRGVEDDVTFSMRVSSHTPGLCGRSLSAKHGLTNLDGRYTSKR